MHNAKLTAARMAIGAISAALLSVAAIQPPEIATADPWNGAPTSVILTAPPRLPDAVEMIKRDPFVGGPVIHDSTQQTQGSDGQQVSAVPGIVAMPAVPPPPRVTPPSLFPIVPSPGTPSIPGFPGSGGSNVPNPGSLVPPGSASSATMTVVGTVVGGGRPPVAMISDGSHVDFAHVGDSISGKKITAIVSQGIEFSDGSRVAVSAGTTNTPTAQPSPSQGDRILMDPPVAAPRGSSNTTQTPGAYPTAFDPRNLGNPALATARPQTNPFDSVQGAAPPTLTPGNYPFGGPPTLSPGESAAPLPRYVQPGQTQPRT